MITGVTVTASPQRLVLWKRLAMRGGPARTLAMTGLMPLALAATALRVLPAHAAGAESPPDLRVMWATPTAVRLGWSAAPGATSYAYQLFQMNGVQVRSGQLPGSSRAVICGGLHPGWRYRAYVRATLASPSPRLTSPGSASPSPGPSRSPNSGSPSPSPGPSPGSSSPAGPGPDQAATVQVTLPRPSPPRELAYQWAETQAGAPYLYGGQGKGGYDCSGLVRTAYQHAGIWLPRTTGEMLQYSKLNKESSPRQGDLVFFGTGHVELYASRNLSFGAQSSRTGTGWNRWWPGNWWPTAFYRVTGAG